MTGLSDARVPVVFAPPAQAGAGDALVLDAAAGVAAGAAAGVVVRLAQGRAGHPFGCRCCQPRGAVAEALGGLFVARARGEVAFFRRVVVSVADPGAVRRAVESDRVVAARYRLDSPDGNL